MSSPLPPDFPKETPALSTLFRIYYANFLKPSLKPFFLWEDFLSQPLERCAAAVCTIFIFLLTDSFSWSVIQHTVFEHYFYYMPDTLYDLCCTNFLTLLLLLACLSSSLDSGFYKEGILLVLLVTRSSKTKSLFST